MREIIKSMAQLPKLALELGVNVDYIQPLINEIKLPNALKFAGFYNFLKEKDLIEPDFFKTNFDPKKFKSSCTLLMNHVIAKIKKNYPLKNSNEEPITLTTEQEAELKEVAVECLKIAEILHLDVNEILGEQLQEYGFLMDLSDLIS